MVATKSYDSVHNKKVGKAIGVFVVCYLPVILGIIGGIIGLILERVNDFVECGPLAFGTLAFVGVYTIVFIFTIIVVVSLIFNATCR